MSSERSRESFTVEDNYTRDMMLTFSVFVISKDVSPPPASESQHQLHGFNLSFNRRRPVLWQFGGTVVVGVRF